ncbi:hypothetical protein C8R42DRAFT_729043 [Lentinula raphanica]|nr:hypothetical protein C8R42DRAFT_729043 [Lentinula raphanica]
MTDGQRTTVVDDTSSSGGIHTGRKESFSEGTSSVVSVVPHSFVMLATGSWRSSLLPWSSYSHSDKSVSWSAEVQTVLPFSFHHLPSSSHQDTVLAYESLLDIRFHAHGPQTTPTVLLYRFVIKPQELFTSCIDLEDERSRLHPDKFAPFSSKPNSRENLSDKELTLLETPIFKRRQGYKNSLTALESTLALPSSPLGLDLVRPPSTSTCSRSSGITPTLHNGGGTAELPTAGQDLDSR